MQSTRNTYVGIDVSKQWFDASLMAVINGQRQGMLTERFDNTVDGLKLFNKWLKQQKASYDDNTIVVIENTGVYHRLIWEYCTQKNIPLHIGNAAGIKWSLGITRGKDDKADSQRLCTYCYRHAEDIKATPALDQRLLQLKDLMTARTRLQSQLKSIRVYLGELKFVSSPGIHKVMEQAHNEALKGLSKSMEKIEDQIKRLVNESQTIKTNYDLLLSVPGIGHLTAVYLICCTANFINRNGKQLASYAGVVPFGNSSGTSIKGRNKVHKMANKDLKKLLHLCALTAIKNYPEFKDYFARKQQQGKHPMAILNAVRNKIALRAMAVIKEQRPYVDNYSKAA